MNDDQRSAPSDDQGRAPSDDRRGALSDDQGAPSDDQGRALSDDQRGVPSDDRGGAPADDRRGASADDEAFARLRAADPAAGVEPDLARVRSALAGVTASTAPTVSTGSTASGSTASPGSAPDAVVVEEITVDELAAARNRRRPARWLQVAAAVAGVAIVGSAGYVVGTARADTTQTADSGDSAGSAEPAIGLAEPGAVPEAARDSAGMSSMASDKASAWYGGRTVFSSSGLSDEGGSGKAWALDAASVYSAATVARLAEVLHVSGDPVQQYGSWTVGPQDGSGPSVSLSPDGTASVSYYDPTRDPWSCVKSAPDEIQQSDPAEGAGTDDGSGGSGVSPVEPPADGPSTCDPSTAAAPGADDAKAQAADLLSAFGIDPAGYELEVVDSGTSQAASVNAYQVVDGARTGVTWSFTILADGVQSLWGSLAPLVELGTYDVVSPSAAVERLGDPRFGASSGGVMPLASTARAAEDGATTDMMPAPEETPTVPATPEAGSPLGWPVQEVEITSARLGVALTTLTDGASVLVPTYELSAADGSTWSVIAVVDDQLDFSPAG